MHARQIRKESWIRRPTLGCIGLQVVKAHAYVYEKQSCIYPHALSMLLSFKNFHQKLSMGGCGVRADVAGSRTLTASLSLLALCRLPFVHIMWHSLLCGIPSTIVSLSFVSVGWFVKHILGFNLPGRGLLLHCNAMVEDIGRKEKGY